MPVRFKSDITHIEYTTIDLDGPNGNAFHLLSIVNNIARMVDADHPQSFTENIYDGYFKRSYYDNLRLINRHYGKYIKFLTDSPDLYELLIEEPQGVDKQLRGQGKDLQRKRLEREREGQRR